MFSFAPPLLALLSSAALVTGPAQGAGLPGTATPTTTAPSPQLTMLAGTILGTDGQPQPGVCVFLVDNRRLIAVTDARGTFQLQAPAAATQHLQAEYIGLGSSRFDIDDQHPSPVRIVLGH